MHLRMIKTTYLILFVNILLQHTPPFYEPFTPPTLSKLNNTLHFVELSDLRAGLLHTLYYRTAAWSNYFWPTGHFTKTRQLAGNFQQNDVA